MSSHGAEAPTPCEVPPQESYPTSKVRSSEMPKQQENWWASGHGSGIPNVVTHQAQSIAETERHTGVSGTVKRMAIFYFFALLFMGGNLGFFIYLDGKSVNASRVPQGPQAAIANIFAIFVELSLIGGIGIAYQQVVWRLFRHKWLKVSLIDRLLTLIETPWHLFSPEVLRSSFLVCLITLICFLVPIAAVFPPGALSVEFQNVEPVSVSNAPTLNLSDYGNGNLRQFLEHAFFSMDAELTYGSPRPELKSLATDVLRSGDPILFSSPCGDFCTYNMTFDGPRFRCKQQNHDADLLNDCQDVYGAVDQARIEGVGYFMENNVFRMSWYPNPSPKGCNPQDQQTMDCAITLATYKLNIVSSRGENRAIERTFENEREIWPSGSLVQVYFNNYFLDENATLHPLSDPDALHTNFTRTQAYALSRAAVDALTGGLQYVYAGRDDSDSWILGNASALFGSPYIGLTHGLNSALNISAASIEKYLDDVTISTMSLNWSQHNGDVEGLVGAEMYQFDGKLFFYAPYALCLFVTAVIYLTGLCALWRNGTAAGDGFLDILSATSSSRALHEKAHGCGHARGKGPSQLEETELKFVSAPSMDGPTTGLQERHIFRTRDEIQPHCTAMFGGEKD